MPAERMRVMPAEAAITGAAMEPAVAVVELTWSLWWSPVAHQRAKCWQLLKIRL
jgi:hypothetical protein